MRFIDRFSTASFLRTILIAGLFTLNVNHAAAKVAASESFYTSMQASPEVQQLQEGIASSKDNQDMPFVILDKKQAKIFVYEKDGRNLGGAPALLGIAIGDKYYPGTGQIKLSQIRVEERTTPAGRFQARLGKNTHGQEVLWVNYDMGIAIHPVVTSNPKEHRLERLRSQDPKQHRISFGCINVPKNFYNTIISPIFKAQGGIVYVLPDEMNIREVFGTYFQTTSI